jgi:hypothetical protein
LAALVWVSLSGVLASGYLVAALALMLLLVVLELVSLLLALAQMLLLGLPTQQ